MKKVVIGTDKNGKPYVISAPKTVQIVFKTEKKRSTRKVIRTWVYRFKSALRIS